MLPIFFNDQSEFRMWLEKNHEKETSLLVGFYKVGGGNKSMTWEQSVDQALCFGWIDGVRKSIDSERYQIRFSQRKPSSTWSAINIRKMEMLEKQGLVYPAGLAIFQNRTESKSRIYSYEKAAVKLSPEFEKKFMAHSIAWNYFQALAPSYKKVSIHWVMDAKTESTQLKRLEELITDSAHGTNKWKDNKYKKV